ncbi:MAG: hypothetical protein ABI305_03020 [Tepidiformaceae bacterium]
MPVRKAALLCALMLAAIPIVAAAAPVPGDTPIVPAIPAVAAKVETFESGARGVDVSWPQCPGNQIPAGEANFVIVGVNGGKAFTRNECFKAQFNWATTGNVKPQLYTNVNGVPASYHNPLCDAPGPSGIACNAYHYGWASSIDAVGFAESQQGYAQIYWLDVETMNYWTSDNWTNAWTVRGAIEGLQSMGKTVGIYSTPYQWGLIAGNYAPQLPVWTAGAEDLTEAQGRCTSRYEFGGGKVALVQYVQGNFDNNFACTSMPQQPANLGAQAEIPPAATPEPSPVPAIPTQAGQGSAPEKSALGTAVNGSASSPTVQPPAWPLSVSQQTQLWSPSAQNQTAAQGAETDPAGASNAQQLRRILNHTPK